jgi:hypothetical protein
MHKIEFEGGGRSMRWYEWLAGLLLLGAAAGVRAAPVYKCVDADGGVAYQQVSCSEWQAQRTMEIAPAPRHAPSPQYAVERRRDEPVARSAPAPREPVMRETAYECRTSDGRMFYRLGACPHSIAGGDSAAKARSKNGSRSSGAVQVVARRMPRDEACREIHRAGAIGRDGHEFDEHVSTYERNLGHDPCKS